MASRVVIATQEPTISPALLDLSSMTIVHRFSSPFWLETLKKHLAGASAMTKDSKARIEEISKHIVELDAGQALLFSPSAMLKAFDQTEHGALRMEKLGLGYAKIQVRERLTADGGRSIMATSTA